MVLPEFVWKLDTIQIILISVGFGVWLFIYAPLAIYHSNKYYSHRNHIVYKARYANITIYEATFVVIKIIYSCFANAIWVIMITDEDNKTNDFIAQCADIGNTVLAYFVIYSWIWRIWMISYNMIWTNSVVNHEWKHIINPLYNEQSIASSHKANWYLMNKKLYGNYKWVQWRLLIIVIISSLINVGVDFISVYYFTDNADNDRNLYIFQMIAGIPWILPYIALCYIWYITPKYLDEFYVLKELKYVFLCLCLDYFVGYLCYMLIMAFYQPKSTNFTRLIESISFHVTITSQFIELMISTLWVNRKVTKIIKYERYKERYIASSEESMNKKLITVEPKKSMSINDTNHITYKLKDILSDSNGIESFIAHLSSEFCIECILSLIEMIQFQTYVINKIDYKIDYKYDSNSKHRLLCKMVTFPESVPLSQIVYDDTINLKQKAFKLYEKYIKNAAEHEINLPFDVRKKLIKMFEKDEGKNIINIKIKDEELLMIFNESCRQMMLLMRDSFNRWKSTNQYEKYIQSISSSFVN